MEIGAEAVAGSEPDSQYEPRGGGGGKGCEMPSASLNPNPPREVEEDENGVENEERNIGGVQQKHTLFFDFRVDGASPRRTTFLGPWLTPRFQHMSDFTQQVERSGHEYDVFGGRLMQGSAQALMNRFEFLDRAYERSDR
jgi:hypothetical protein